MRAASCWPSSASAASRSASASCTSRLCSGSSVPGTRSSRLPATVSGGVVTPNNEASVRRDAASSARAASSSAATCAAAERARSARSGGSRPASTSWPAIRASSRARRSLSWARRRRSRAVIARANCSRTCCARSARAMLRRSWAAASSALATLTRARRRPPRSSRWLIATVVSRPRVPLYSPVPAKFSTSTLSSGLTRKPAWRMRASADATFARAAIIAGERASASSSAC